MHLLRHMTAAAIAGFLAMGAWAQDNATAPATQPGQQSADASYNPQDAAYGLGYSIGRDIKSQQMPLDTDAFVSGLRASLEGTDPRLTEAQMQSAIEKFQQAMIRRQMQQFREQAQQAGESGNVQLQQQLEAQASQMQQMLERRAQGEQNVAAAGQFLDQNKAEPDVQVTDSGLQYKVLEEGDGPSPDENDVVKVHYRGTLLDGTEFDSSYARGEPATFGVNQVIAGWTEALQKMKVGGKWKLWIPPDLAYGSRGQGPIPPNSLLVFEVELLEIVSEN